MACRSRWSMILIVGVFLAFPAQAAAQAIGGGAVAAAVALPGCDEYCAAVYEDGEQISNACILDLNSGLGEGIECRATQSECWFDGLCVEANGSMIIDETGIEAPSCLKQLYDS